MIYSFAILQEVVMKLDWKEERKAERQEKNDVYYEYYLIMIIYK